MKQTSLHRAALEGQRKIVDLLLEKGANIEAEDEVLYIYTYQSNEHTNIQSAYTKTIIISVLRKNKICKNTHTRGYKNA
jgi:hypothetical protein